MIRHTVHTVSTSRADDAAFRALADASDLLEASDTRIVGGQMVALLLLAFPTREAIVRKTADADLAIPTTLAAAGTLHERLTAAGYEATAGNSYSKEASAIDLLVPTRTGRFSREEHGGRGFDAAPGISLALAAAPVALRVRAMLLDHSTLEFETLVPGPDVAIVLKAYAIRLRAAAKDVVDVHNLLSIADVHPYTAIGGWSLANPALRGSRLDAARILHGLAGRARRDRTAHTAGVNPARLTALIRRHIAAP